MDASSDIHTSTTLFRKLRSAIRYVFKELPDPEARKRRKVSQKLRVALFELNRRWTEPPAQSNHNLDRELIVSLTSYEKRFSTLANTIMCLMTQTVRPNRIVMWLTKEDELLLPNDVKKLVGTNGFEVRITPDTRSYKKIIPSLSTFPKSYIATADDDAYYPADWLERMTREISTSKNQIVCHRAHGLKTLSSGEIAPYSQWDYEANEFSNTVLFPTGVGGILYSPNSLGDLVYDQDLFTKLCPRGDDVWLAWMGHMAGSEYIKLFNTETPITWDGSQEVGLINLNVGESGNDTQVRAIFDYFGPIERGIYRVV